MIKLSIGFVIGLIVATVGFSGVAKLSDQAVDSAKHTLTEQVKK